MSERRVVWKQVVGPVGVTAFPAATTAVVRSFGLDPGGNLAVWYETDPDAEKNRSFAVAILMTGKPVDLDGLHEFRFVGTVIEPNLGLVFHAYVAGEVMPSGPPR